MKQCPGCGRTYTDELLNFCLDDGELLIVSAPSSADPLYANDSPPTVMFEEARRTNPANWPTGGPASPPSQWQAPVQMPYGPAGFQVTPNQTLAIVSLGLGIGAMTIGWCCSLGMILAPAGLITGFIALSQNKKDPTRYGGRGLAIGGVVTSAIFFVFYVLVLLVWGLSFLGR